MSSSQPWICYANIARLENSFVLSLLTKRTYQWDDSGTISLADEQQPMAMDIEHEKREEDRNCTVLKHGCDTWPVKLATDVVITGSAHSANNDPVTQMMVTASIGQYKRGIQVFGPRYVSYKNGQVLFSSPEPFTTAELSWWNAYGGVDPMTLPRGLTDTPLFCGKPLVELFPGTYPRNPCGVGYIVRETPELLDGLTLPLLENPDHLLSPNDLIVRDARRWWRQPMPACFGWFHTLWFPRLIHTSAKPYHLPSSVPDENESNLRLKELELGLVTAQQLDNSEARIPNLHMTNEAAPEMILPSLQGNETIYLNGFSPKGELKFELPQEPVLISAKLDGRFVAPTASRLHTLAIDTEKKQFYLLRATLFELPYYLAKEIATGAKLESLVPRFEILVDKKALTPDQWPEPDGTEKSDEED